MRPSLYRILLLLVLALPVQAEEYLFYQPLNMDAALSDTQWRQIWQNSAQQGVQTLIVQWSAYGDERFGGADGWLAQALRQAQDSGLKLVIGLHMDPAYYQRLNELDSGGLDLYWQYQLGRSLAQSAIIREQWQLSPAGWYLPLELDDLHFAEQGRRQALHEHLQDFAGKLDAPLHLSAFTAGRLAPAVYSGWLQGIAALGIQVWWQDGAGTAAIAPAVRRHYAGALPCKIGIIREAFRQTSSPQQAFRAVPAEAEQADSCHPQALFELRYLPWGQSLQRPQ